MIRLGIDLTHQHVHAALVTGETVLSTSQVSSGLDLAAAIQEAIISVMKSAGTVAAEIGSVVVGAGFASNALADTPELGRVAVARIGGPSTSAVPPFTGWPADVAQRISAGSALIEGGIDVAGRSIAALDEHAIETFFLSLDRESTDVAITSAFSAIDNSQELRARQIARRVLGSRARVVTSHDVGGNGLIYRENATVLNAALMSAMDSFIATMRRVLAAVELDHAVLACSHNDGSAMVAEYARLLPVRTVASHTANAAQGASLLSGASHGVSVSLSSDEVEVCVFADGVALEHVHDATLSGVRVRHSAAHAERFTLPTQHRHTPELSLRLEAALQEAISQISPDHKAAPHRSGPIPLVVVGEAHEQFERLFTRPATVLPRSSLMKQATHPPHAESAAAVGAAYATVHGNAELVVELGRVGTERLQAELKAKAFRDAVRAGADPATLELQDVIETPLTYFSEAMVRLSARAVGVLTETHPQ